MFKGPRKLRASKSTVRHKDPRMFDFEPTYKPGGNKTIDQLKKENDYLKF